MEGLREHNNFNACNHRRPISSEHRAAFPEVDFGAVDPVGPAHRAEWLDDASYKDSFAFVRARAAKVYGRSAPGRDRPEARGVTIVDRYRQVPYSNNNWNRVNKSILGGFGRGSDRINEFTTSRTAKRKIRPHLNRCRLLQTLPATLLHHAGQG